MDMADLKQEITERVCKVLVKKIDVNYRLLTEEGLELPLTGRKIGLRARDLVYLFFEVEKEFDIKINTDNLENYKFNTILGIVELVMEQKANVL